MVKWKIVLHFFLLSFFFLLPFESSFGSERSQAIVNEGVQALDRNDYAGALQKFTAASKEDPTDGRAAFFQGVALNRLGRHEKALMAFHRSAKHDYSHPEADFEAGWAQMGLKQWNAALDSFGRHEKSHPGRGQTSEFTGRCQFALRRYDEAVRSFHEAQRRDPSLKPTVEFYLAILEKRRDNEAAGEMHLKNAMETDTPLGRALRGEAAEIRRIEAAPERNFGVSFTALVGYNDNVIALGNTIPLPSDITRKDATFIRGTLGLGYSGSGAVSGLNVGYSLTADAYDGISSANTVDHFLYASYSKAVDDSLSGSLRFSDEFTQVGGHAFRNQIGARIAGAYRLARSSVIEVGYERGESNYQLPSIDPQNRNGNSDLVSLQWYFALNGKPLGSLGYSHMWTRARGSDFTFQTNSLSVNLGYPLVWGVIGDASYSYARDSYANPNSLSSAGPAREDGSHVVSIRLTKPVAKHCDLFAQFQAIRDYSNIAFYSYGQNVTLIGASASY